MTRGLFGIGAGAAGGSLLLSFKEAGGRICGLYDEDGARAGHLAEKLGLPARFTTFEMLARAKTVLVAVPEGAIEEVARRAAGEGLCRGDQVWLHTAGARGSGALEPVRALVAGVGVFHPPLAFPAGLLTPVPPGVVFSTGGDEAARVRAAQLAKRLGGATADIEDGDRTVYHAACVVAANYVTTLLDQAGAVLSRIGVEETLARRIAAQLAESAAKQVRRRPAPEALSGPVRRGDAKTVEEHLQALAELPETKALYRHLGRLTVELARRGEPPLPEDRACALRELLEEE